ncbi:PaaI family thioesterase [Pseudonocardia nigra]|uniref:PaaI family thioesterase n=1 Tax=Pseudonocardia nigra TaxID=1921578 RepID=UPI001C5F4C3F|nr:PaaI family thioesterase [Pseudonocardia nigra]
MTESTAEPTAEPTATADDAATEQLHTAMPFTALLGATAVASNAEEVRLRLDWDATRCTAGGLLHGGALMSLADAAGGLCAYLNLPEGATGTATITSATNFLRGVRSGHVEAYARPLTVGRTVIVIDIELHDADGRLAARVTQTQAVLR